MELFESLLYALAILTSLACTVFLFLGYVRRRLRLLLWSTLCFASLTVGNVLLFVDLLIVPDVDLRLGRLLAALLGVTFLLYGFIWDSE